MTSRECTNQSSQCYGHKWILALAASLKITQQKKLTKGAISRTKTFVFSQRKYSRKTSWEVSPSLAKCTQIIESAIPQDKLAKPRPNLSINRLESLNGAFKPQKQNKTEDWQSLAHICLIQSNQWMEHSIKQNWRSLALLYGLHLIKTLEPIFFFLGGGEPCPHLWSSFHNKMAKPRPHLSASLTNTGKTLPTFVKLVS